jgi:hypothetical protein
VKIGPNRFCFDAKFLHLLPTFRPDRLGEKNLDLGRKRNDEEEVDTKEIELEPNVQKYPKMKMKTKMKNKKQANNRAFEQKKSAR